MKIDEKPWFRYRARLWPISLKPLWYPCSWSGWIWLLSGLVSCIYGPLFAAEIWPDNPFPPVIAFAVLAVTFVWIGSTYSESDENWGTPARKFRDDP